jgi:hypothetical protein
MWTDGDPEELHAFAARLGLIRAWFQHGHVVDHYDLTASKRALALKMGAVPTDLKEWLKQNHPRLKARATATHTREEG